MILEELNEKHKQTLLKWRNDPTVRENSFNNRMVSQKEHDAWFFRFFQNKNAVAYIALEQNKPVGIIRFEESDRRIRVSITIDPEKQGRGLGSTLIQKGVKKFIESHHPQKVIVAEIFPNNISSTKAFSKAGFKHAYTTYHLPPSIA